jgi:hypothetical protein
MYITYADNYYVVVSCTGSPNQPISIRTPVLTVNLDDHRPPSLHFSSESIRTIPELTTPSTQANVSLNVPDFHPTIASHDGERWTSMLFAHAHRNECLRWSWDEPHLTMCPFKPGWKETTTCQRPLEVRDAIQTTKRLRSRSGPWLCSPERLLEVLG